MYKTAHNEVTGMETAKLFHSIKPRGFFRVAAGFSGYDGDLSLPLGLALGSLPLGLALGSPIFPSGCEGKLGVALESPQARRDLT